MDGVIEAFFDKLSFFSVPLRLPAALEDAAPELPPGIETLFSWMKGNDEGWKKVTWSFRGLEATIFIRQYFTIFSHNFKQKLAENLRKVLAELDTEFAELGQPFAWVMSLLEIAKILSY